MLKLLLVQMLLMELLLSPRVIALLLFHLLLPLIPRLLLTTNEAVLEL